ncbi:trans-sialidase [Trypanosoma cruzi]|nr:trans-sialidase [Trypanosoma cruzi]
MFVPGRTHLEPKGGTGASGRRDSFGSLALVGVGGVTVFFDWGYTTLNGSDGAPSGLSHADIVAGSIFFAWILSYFFGEFNNGRNTRILLSTANMKGGVGFASNPTAIESGNRAFLRAGS